MTEEEAQTCPSGGLCTMKCYEPHPLGYTMEICDPVKTYTSTADPMKDPYMTSAPTLDTTLAERGTRYGEFIDQATIAQGFVSVAHQGANYFVLAADQKEALSVIFNKIARILNGDPDYSDSWHDIAGYATLVDKRLKALGK